jgi:hypothetical protein
MTDAQQNQQAVALAGRAPAFLRRKVAGFASERERARWAKSLRQSEQALKAVQRKYGLRKPAARVA